MRSCFLYRLSTKVGIQSPPPFLTLLQPSLRYGVHIVGQTLE